MADQSNRHHNQKPINNYNNNRRRRNYNPSSSYSYSNNNNNNNINNNNNNNRIKNISTDDNYNDDSSSNQPNSIIGTCPFMCPVDERARRERLRDLSVFERLYDHPAQTSPSLAVKKFCRTISTMDMKASDVRPVPVLEDTLNYLLNLLHSSDRPFEVVHDFIFDRTRSIRQDLSMQNITGDRVIHMYERMVKFHIISHHHLHRSCGGPDTASLRHLNLEQLIKALTTLFNLYEVNRASNSVSKNEAEFCSFYLLLHLGSDNQGESLSLWFRRVPSLIMNSKEMSFARRILRYYRLGNYKRFIDTTEDEASYLQYWILEPYINEVRILALSSISYGGYKQQPYPLAYLSKILMMKESDVESLCIECALETSVDGTGKGLLSTKQSVTISRPKQASQRYYPVDSIRIERLSTELPEL